MKKKTIVNQTLFVALLIIATISLSSCQKTWESLKKGLQTTDRNYEIEQYSGGRLIAVYKFRGILNDSEGSDGCYFYKGDTLVELSGDLIIKSTK